MASEKRLEANRRNSARSTGPRTPAGKAASRGNALKHGLCAESMLLPGEHAADLETLRAGLWVDLHPSGALEESLAGRVVAGVWRLQRALRVETAVGEQHAAEVETDDYYGDLPKDIVYRRRLAAWIVDEDMDRVLRYEAERERQVYRALAQLERIQGRRGSDPRDPAPPPPAGCRCHSSAPAPREETAAPGGGGTTTATAIQRNEPISASPPQGRGEECTTPPVREHAPPRNEPISAAAVPARPS